MAVTSHIVTVMSKLVLLLVLFPVLKIKSSFLDIEELQKSKYVVDISGEPVLLNQDTDENIMHIKSKHGQQYQCVLPVVHVQGDKVNMQNITTDEINNLLKPVNNTCLYFLHGWWTYKACFGKSVYQYHDEGMGQDNVKDNISLGDYTGETDWSYVNIEENSNDKEQYHSQFYSNGTLCDLTGEPRKTEVRFLCSQVDIDNIARINERSTCSYVITVYTNKLCNHSLFRPKQPVKRHSISCSPALLHEQYMKYRKSKENDIEDISVNDMLSKSGTVNEVVEEPKPKRRTPSIFEAIGRLFQKPEPKNDNENDENKIDWDNVFKTSRRVIDESVERIRKGNIAKKLEDLADNVDPREGNEMASTPEIEKGKTNGMKSVLNDFKEAEKERLDKESRYYQDLIESLKIQYRYFKKELEIVTRDMHTKIEKLENGDEKLKPTVIRLVERIKATVKQFEENQKNLDVEMERLTDLNDAVMKDGNPADLKDEISGIRSRLYKLMKKISSRKATDDHDDNDEIEPVNVNDLGNEKKNSMKGNVFDMGSRKLDKVVSKLKKIMTQDAEEDNVKETDNSDMLDDDHISVRVMKIKDDEDLFDKSDKSLYGEDGKGLEEISDDDEMMAATKKMETIVRKQLRESGIQHEGKVKVKIITSKDALKKVSSGSTGFQILSPDETNEFRDLLSNLLGSNRESVKEKERQHNLENNYSLVWTQNGFTSAKHDYSSVDDENEDRKTHT